jgi:predicted RNase H-like HicB family nuclease
MKNNQERKDIIDLMVKDIQNADRKLKKDSEYFQEVKNIYNKYKNKIEG